jgi:60 kDa SS-A/Ro ribonucleoprotein
VVHGGNDIPAPKLVCIDLQPYTTTQAPDRDDILNIGGFSDAVFSVVAAFLAEDTGRSVAEVEAVEL